MNLSVLFAWTLERNPQYNTLDVYLLFFKAPSLHLFILVLFWIDSFIMLYLEPENEPEREPPSEPEPESGRGGILFYMILCIYVTVAHKKKQGIFCLFSLFKSCDMSLKIL